MLAKSANSEYPLKKCKGIKLRTDKLVKVIMIGLGSILVLSLTLAVGGSLVACQRQVASAAEPAQPDLIVETISWSPENPSKDAIVTISAMIKNQGDGRAIRSQLSFYIDGSYRSIQYVESLEAGESATVEFTWTAGQGNHLIQMVIDEGNTVSESNETNNEKSATISSLDPDLIIQTITWSPVNPLVGTNVTFTVTIMNQGDGKAINPLVAFHVDDERLDSKSLGVLASGETSDTTFIWLAQPESHDIELIVDPGNSILESNENNNKKTADVPGIFPDLSIANITWTPAEPSVGETVTFSVSIVNQGRIFASSTTYSYYVGSQDSGNKKAPSVAANSSIIDTFTWVARGGTNLVRVVLDTTNKIAEENESNNEMIVTFSGTKLPDLAIQNLSWSPANPLVGETMTFLVTIKNEGMGHSGSTQATYYIDDIQLESAKINPIAPNSTQNTTFTWTVQEGHHTIKVVANTNMLISESNEENNEKTVIYPVPPDLIIRDIALSPEEPTKGDNVTFIVTITNQGIGATEKCSIGYYIDDDYLGYSEAEVLTSGITDNSSFVWVATSGSHTLKAIVDTFGTVIESNEENNEIIRLFSIPEVGSPTTPPDTPTPPDTGTEQPQIPGTSNPGNLVIPNPGSPGGEDKNNMLLYYLLGLAGFVVIAVIFFEVWRRQD
ncbi:CARDB domain-containing protein [Chloroflexota bacterium]